MGFPDLSPVREDGAGDESGAEGGLAAPFPTPFGGIGTDKGTDLCKAAPFPTPFVGTPYDPANPDSEP